jgi:hypothetical protein
MSDRRGQPAYALRPSPASEGAASAAKLITERPIAPPAPLHSGPVAVAPSHARSGEPTGDGQWGELATAPTLLLAPRENAGEGEAVSTTRIATPAAMAADPAWFRSGNTMPPPSMRPPADSTPTIAEKRPPNPRVVKVVGGVIGACLFIVAVASVKLLYQRAASAGTRDEATASSAQIEAARVAPAPATATPPQAPEAQGAAAPSAVPAPPAAIAAPGPTAVHAAPARAPSPARVTTKPAPRRAPVTKKHR